MPAGADRAINMALRVVGVGEVERDFKKAGAAGEQSFQQVEKAANGANKEISEYTARLKRVQAAAKQAFDANKDVQIARRLEPQGYQSAKNQFVLGAVQAEQKLMQQGVAESTSMWQAATGAAETYTGSLMAVGVAAGMATGLLAGLARLTIDSVSAWEEHSKTLEAFEANLRLVGNQSTATATEIEQMARGIADATGQTEKSALSAAQQLATIPGITKQGLEAALDASSRLATALGEDVEQTVSGRVIPVFQALTNRDLGDLVKALDGKVSPALATLVFKLAEAGKTAEAQQAFVQGLADAAGEGPDGLTTAGNRASAAWQHLKETLGQDIAGPAAAALNGLATWLDTLRAKANATGNTWAWMAGLIAKGASPGGAGALFQEGTGLKFSPANAAPKGPPDISGSFRDYNAAPVQFGKSDWQKIVDSYGGGKGSKTGGSGRTRSGGGGGTSSAEREAQARQREAEQAQNAADRLAESNDKVVASYEERAKEVEAKVGLEGDALKNVERQQRIEAAVRRISTEEIEKQVEARRKEAIAAGKQFDEAKATAEATAAVQAKSEAVREYAARIEDANDAIAEFQKNEQIAARILDELKTPLDRVNESVDDAVKALLAHTLTVDQFDARMKQLAGDMADARLEMDKSRQAWVGFGQDVGRTLTDVILNGGSAHDVLQKLIQLPLQRLLEQNVETPIANWIDGLTGVNRDKNTAKELAGLPKGSAIAGANVQVLDGAAASAAASVTNLATAANNATVAMGGAPAALSDPISQLASQTDAASQAFGELIPLTGQFGGTLGQVISLLSAGGGGGGFFSSLLSIGGSVLGGGLKIGGAGLSSNAAAAAAGASYDFSSFGNISLKGFAGGTDDVPWGKPFFVGENGIELMHRDRSGRLSVLSGPKTHRMLDQGSGGGPMIVQNITIPERADPRRTASSLARAAQGGIARANRKGLAR